MAEQPDTTVVVLYPGFHSAQLRHALNAALAPEDAARVRVRALFDSDCTASNWWTSRKGIKKFGIEWLRWLYTWCIGAGNVPPPCESADAYESNVRRTLAEETP